MKNKDYYPFEIGQFKCTILKDLDFVYNASDFATNAPENELNDMVMKYHNKPGIIPSPFIAMWIDTGEEQILIDSGAGYSDEPFNFGGHEIFIKGRLQDVMKKAGINRNAIDKVILTHFHPDHIGGLFSDQGEANFPNAKYIFHQEEWEFWFSEKANLMPPFFMQFIENQIAPLERYKTLSLTGEDNELCAGVHALHMPGHTPGHLMVSVESDNQKLIYATDTILHPMHLEKLDWKTAFDYDPELALFSRRKLIEMTSSKNTLLCMFHFPFPGLGHVIEEGKHWTWQAVG